MSESIRCADACGRVVADMQEAEQKAWTRLEITGRYRCPDCRRALDAINFPPAKATGTPS